jgi:hypothetical protein
MSRAMCDQWKQVDHATRNIFQELVEEGKVMCLKQSLEAKQKKTKILKYLLIRCAMQMFLLTSLSGLIVIAYSTMRLQNLQEMFTLLLTSNPQYFWYLLYHLTMFTLVVSRDSSVQVPVTTRVNLHLAIAFKVLLVSIL